MLTLLLTNSVAATGYGRAAGDQDGYRYADRVAHGRYR
jgi:hypothetical protein